MDKTIKILILLIFYCLILAGLLITYINVIQPIIDYKTYNEVFFSPFIISNVSDVNEVAIGIAKENVRIHKTIHDAESVLLCEELNDGDCFVSGNLIVFSEMLYSVIPLIEGHMPASENEIVVSENISKLLKLKVGDPIEVKNFLILKKLTISGITKNLYGFPGTYNPSQLDTVILGDSEINWQSYKPFSIFSTLTNIANLDTNGDTVVICKLSLYSLLFAITAIFGILIKYTIGLEKYINHQIILGKTLRRRRLIYVFADTIVLFVLGSICLLLFQFSSIKITATLYIVMSVFLLDILFQYLRMR